MRLEQFLNRKLCVLQSGGSVTPRLFHERQIEIADAGKVRERTSLTKFTEVRKDVD